MPKAITVELKGLKDAAARLHNVKQSVRTAILKPAINEGTKPVEKAARSRVTKSSGLLKKSIGRKVIGNRTSGVVVGLIGPRKGFGATVTRADGTTVYEDPVHIAHLVEFGRRAVEARGKVLSTGKGGRVFGKRVKAAPARPFLRPAWTATKAEAERVIAARVKVEIAKQAAKGKL